MLPGYSVVKKLPTNARDSDLIPGSADCLEKEMATHFSILAWEIPWTDELGCLQSVGSQKSQIHVATKQQQQQQQQQQTVSY